MSPGKRQIVRLDGEIAAARARGWTYTAEGLERERAEVADLERVEMAPDEDTDGAMGEVRRG